MYRRIVVALDGTQPAEAALSYAETLARAADGTLYLVRAAPPDDKAAARRYLGEMAAGLQARGMAVEALTPSERPADAVAAAAERCQADLVVMATHGRTGLDRSVHGSVTDVVLHRTATPLLLVQRGQEAPAGWPHRALVPLDGSDLAERALDYALSAVGAADVVLYQAVLPEATTFLGQLEEEPVWVRLLDDAEREAREYPDGVAARQRVAGRQVQTVAELTAPGPGIAEYCHRERVDLIVLSSHGRAGVQRWLFGSVADDLLRQAPAPLLLLRPLLDAARLAQPATRPRVLPRPASQAPLGLSERQVELLQLALDRLLQDPARDAKLTSELQALNAQLGAAPMAGGAAESAAAGTRPADALAVAPGYPVFARPGESLLERQVGPFVGVVEAVLENGSLRYLHVRGGIDHARDLFLPVDTVRMVVGHQVHLNLMAGDLLGKVWHHPPRAALRAS